MSDEGKFEAKDDKYRSRRHSKEEKKRQKREWKKRCREERKRKRRAAKKESAAVIDVLDEQRNQNDVVCENVLDVPLKIAADLLVENQEFGAVKERREAQAFDEKKEMEVVIDVQDLQDNESVKASNENRDCGHGVLDGQCIAELLEEDEVMGAAKKRKNELC